MNFEPKSINVSSNLLTIEWADGVVSQLASHLVRSACNCANCVSEITGERLVGSDQIEEHIQITAAEPTGNYAVSLKFSDGHSTGIYTFEHLRKLNAEE